MKDRALQALYLLAVDQVVECQSDPNSYGFRQYRSAQDAITTLRNLLDKRYSPTYILETMLSGVSTQYHINTCWIIRLYATRMYWNSG
jgi:RNA-directed DNA polymerase